MLKTLFHYCCVAGLLLTVSFSAHAIAPSSKPLDGSQIGLAYMMPGSNKVYGIHKEQFFHPASTQKVITALAAVLYLGRDHKFITKLEVRKSVIDEKQKLIVHKGTLNSDVIVRFTGDPTLRIDHYRKLLQILKQHKVNTIKGDVILDVSRFGGPSRGQGWSWDDLPVCFTAPSAPIILNRNCTFAQLKSTPIGTKTSPLIPKSTPIRITADVMTVNPRDYGGDCILEANLFIDNAYHLTGCVPKQEDNKPWPLSLAVADSERWGLDWTKQLLDELDIKVTGEIRISHTPESDTSSIGQRASPPLHQLLTYMLQKSNNLYADSIAKNVAAEYYNLPATYHRTTRAIRSILRQYAKINLENVYMVDASGLSPHNLVSPEIMIKVMDYINKHDDTLGIIDMLPVSGKSGTLHWRASTVNSPLKYHVFAKTGTLQNVSTLAGFVLTKNKKRIPFVMYTNSITYPERIRDRVRYHRITPPNYAYERYVLENLWNERHPKDAK